MPALIVECNALPMLVLILRSEDTGVHYEAVGVIGNLVHSLKMFFMLELYTLLLNCSCASGGLFYFLCLFLCCAF